VSDTSGKKVKIEANLEMRNMIFDENLRHNRRRLTRKRTQNCAVSSACPVGLTPDVGGFARLNRRPYGRGHGGDGCRRSGEEGHSAGAFKKVRGTKPNW
jgi:hypothetical protein